MSTVLTIFGLVIGLLILAAIVSGSVDNAKKKETDEALSKIKDFSPYIKFDGHSGGWGLAIDPDRSKLAILKGGQGIRVIKFANILQVETLKNGSSIHKTNRGSQLAGAAIGGVLFGGVGAIVGGLSGSSRTEETVSKLSLKIYTDDMIDPIQEVVFFKGPAPVSNPMVQQASGQLDGWYARLRAVVNKSQAA